MSSSARRESLVASRWAESPLAGALAVVYEPWIDGLLVPAKFAAQIERIRRGFTDEVKRGEVSVSTDDVMRVLDRFKALAEQHDQNDYAKYFEKVASDPAQLHRPPSTTIESLDDLPPDLAEFMASTPFFEGTVPSLDEDTQEVISERVHAGLEVTRLLALAAVDAGDLSLFDLLSAKAQTVLSRRGAAKAARQVTAADAITVRTLLLLGLDLTALRDVLDGCDDRDVDVLLSRMYPDFDTRMTLEALGDKHGVTRERVRQIQKRLERDLAPFNEQIDAVADHLVDMFGLLPTAVNVRDSLTALFGGLGDTESPIVINALVNAAYTAEGDLLQARKLDEILEAPTAAALAGAAHHVLAQQPAEKVAMLIGDRLDLLGWFRLPAGPHAGTVLDKSTKGARIAAGLWLHGEPATKEQIAEAAGYGPDQSSRISSTMSNIPDVVRADIDKWGYAEWVDDVYEGIAGEIVQRVEAAGGVARLDDVIADILDTFNVSESSVRSYTMSDQFRIDNGRISVADADSIEVPTDARNVDGAVETDHGWAQPVKVEPRHFDGFSLIVNKKIAGANGIRPTDSLMVPMAGTGHDVSVIWRLTALNGAEVGRVAKPLDELGVQPGDTIFICPTTEAVHVVTKADAEWEQITATQEAIVDPLAVLNHDGGLL